MFDVGFLCQKYFSQIVMLLSSINVNKERTPCQKKTPEALETLFFDFLMDLPSGFLVEFLK